MKQDIRNILSRSIELKQRLLSSDEILLGIDKIVDLLVTTYQKGGKVLFCGNGGSAADAQHLATELSGRYYLDRPALFAEALHVNTSFLTAVGNDFGFEHVFSRALEAMGKKGDVLFALSTSGNSPNILKALEKADEMGIFTVGLTGLTGGRMNGNCSHVLKVPSEDTPRIQEGHMLLGHVICELVEKKLFEKNKSHETIA